MDMTIREVPADLTIIPEVIMAAGVWAMTIVGVWTMDLTTGIGKSMNPKFRE